MIVYDSSWIPLSPSQFSKLFKGLQEMTRNRDLLTISCSFLEIFVFGAIYKGWPNISGILNSEKLFNQGCTVRNRITFNRKVNHQRAVCLLDFAYHLWHSKSISGKCFEPMQCWLLQIKSNRLGFYSKHSNNFKNNVNCICYFLR